MIGSNNSAHDICKALFENGVDVTMVQRSSTHIVQVGFADGSRPRRPVLRAGGGRGHDHREGRPDVRLAAVPDHARFQIPIYDAIRERDKDFYDRLAAAGFELDWGDDDSGLFMKYLRRGSGYYIDVGACDLIADGSIKLAHGQVDRLTEDSVVLDRRHGAARRCGGLRHRLRLDERLGRRPHRPGRRRQGRQGLGPRHRTPTKDPGPWEGEQRNMWKPTQQENLWFHGGNLHQSRHYSLYLALQLKARYEGIPTPVYGLQEVHHLS